MQKGRFRERVIETPGQGSGGRKGNREGTQRQALSPFPGDRQGDTGPQEREKQSCQPGERPEQGRALKRGRKRVQWRDAGR